MSSSEKMPQVIPISEEFIPSLVKVHREAFAGYMNTQLGDAYIKAFLRWFCFAENGIALMLTDSERKNAVGYVVGAPAEWDLKASKDLVLPAAFGVASHPRVIFNKKIRDRVVSRTVKMFRRKHTSETPTPDLPKPIMALVGIGISEKWKGKGYAGLLMEAFEKRARELDMRSMFLEVYTENKRARKFYEKCNWLPFVEPSDKNAPMFYSKQLV